MEIVAVFQAFPAFFITVISIFGLMVGSFLNVVIYRLPIMMERGWKRECQEFLQLEIEESERFDLILPNSCCPNCQADIKPWQNIPIISYLFLGGKCANCKTGISIRYPLVEAFTGLLSAIIAMHYGCQWEVLPALLLTWCLIALSGIDIDKQLLPDSITIPLLWCGLFLSLFNLYTDSHSAIIGALAGYLSLWIVFQLFKLITGKEGMGFGDFKLLALFGAWIGWQYLPLIVLLSSLVGTIVGVSLVVFKQHDQSKPIPFGPYIAAAGWIALLWGQEINHWYLDISGLS